MQATANAAEVLNDPCGQAVTILTPTPIIIVSFMNAADVRDCLAALACADPAPPFAVFVSENGGRDAFDRLVIALTASDAPCVPEAAQVVLSTPRFRRTDSLRLRTRYPSSGTRVYLGESVENLGYAGGVNAWLEPLLALPGWSGVWILNPDTQPAPDALKQLADYAQCHGRGMVGSRLVTQSSPDIVHSRGLAWQKWRAATKSVDFRSPATVCPPHDDVDRRLDAPSGASIYVTRDCIECIGLMDERYFLYFEDLDWGKRAKACGGVGYAHGSIVVHEGGTTIGTSVSRHNQSSLAVYLDFRNRLLFVRRHFVGWLPWTVLAELAEIAEYGRLRAFSNMRAALRGMVAGLFGRSGRPDGILLAHIAAKNRDK